MSTDVSGPDEPQFDLAAETISLRIRWFGVCVGFAFVNLVGPELLPEESVRNVAVLNLLLGFGAAYAVFDTLWSSRNRVFLSDWPLAVSCLETIFIGLLCWFDGGQESAFRFYYVLSVVVCAIRYSPRITWTTLILHVISYSSLLAEQQHSEFLTGITTVVALSWVTWASTSMAALNRAASTRLVEVNERLEHRIAVRTQELRESQAMLVQHEKQAAFGLLAAGIAHEVGNPLAAISSLVQLLRRKEADDETQQRYQMIGDQLRRIQGTLRELVDFSRPASTQAALCNPHEAVEAALNIAKYYKRRKGKRILIRYAEGLPALRVVRDQLVQVFLNLILNAMDATPEGALIEISTSLENGWLRVAFRDTGHGISEENRGRVFEPYFTTKETGTGLGLFVCRQILERGSGSTAAQGRIELTDTGPHGTTISILLSCENTRHHPDIPVPDVSQGHVLSVQDSVLPADPAYPL